MAVQFLGSGCPDHPVGWHDDCPLCRAQMHDAAEGMKRGQLKKLQAKYAHR